MHYGLAKIEQKYYKDKLNRFISLAPCVYDSSRTNRWKTSAYMYETLLDLGVYYYGGKDLASLRNAFRVCRSEGRDSDLCGIQSLGSSKHAILNELYNDQIWISERFQEPPSH